MGLKIIVNNAHEALILNEQVQEMCSSTDYSWKYTPAINSWLGDETLSPATAEFSFKDAQWATYFQLRWSK
jgi:hypothetical protein